MAESYIGTSAMAPAGAAELADERKVAKYAFIPTGYVFQPIAIETMRPLNQTGLDFIGELGHRMQQAFGDTRERTFLFQRISVTIQRFIAVSFADGSFVDKTNIAG